MLSEARQRKTNTVSYHLYVELKKYNKLVNITEKQQTNRYREQTSGHQWGEGRWEEQEGVEDSEAQTIIHKISCKNILYNTGNIANIL